MAFEGPDGGFDFVVSRADVRPGSDTGSGDDEPGLPVDGELVVADLSVARRPSEGPLASSERRPFSVVRRSVPVVADDVVDEPERGGASVAPGPAVAAAFSSDVVFPDVPDAAVASPDVAFVFLPAFLFVVVVLPEAEADEPEAVVAVATVGRVAVAVPPPVAEPELDPESAAPVLAADRLAVVPALAAASLTVAT